MILINEEIYPKSLSNRKEQLIFIERKLLEDNFNKYSIYTCLWIFDEVKKGFLRFEKFSHLNYNSSFFCKIILEADKVIFNLSDIEYNNGSYWKEHFPKFLSEISQQANPYYSFEKVERGFNFKPASILFPNKWYSDELKKSRKYYLTCGPISVDGFIATATYQMILRIMTATNTKIGINSKDGNSINIDIEVSTL